jgi:hypothetical protein
MTPAQNLIIKSYIASVPELAALPNDTDGAYAMTPVFNALAAPDFIVWKTSVNPDDIMRNGMDWTRVDNLTIGKARIWDWLTRLGAFNPSKVNVRAGIDAAWVGSAADLAVRAQVYTHCKRAATLIEKLLATGTGSNAVPAALGFEGAISYQGIDIARHSDDQGNP